MNSLQGKVGLKNQDSGNQKNKNAWLHEKMTADRSKRLKK